MTGGRVDTSRDTEAAQLYKAGYSTRDIAERFGYGRRGYQIVVRALKRKRVLIRKSGWKIRPDRTDRRTTLIALLSAAGVHPNTIARTIGAAISIVYEVQGDLGVPSYDTPAFDLWQKRIIACVREEIGVIPDAVGTAASQFLDVSSLNSAAAVMSEQPAAATFLEAA